MGKSSLRFHEAQSRLVFGVREDGRRGLSPYEAGKLPTVDAAKTAMVALMGPKR